MELVDQLARTLLYEGYLLYPYRADAVKNRQRFTFGALYPPACCQSGSSDASAQRVECLVETSEHTTLSARVRFLHLMARQVEKTVAGGSFESVASLSVEGRTYQSWQEAVEREVRIEEIQVVGETPSPRPSPDGRGRRMEFRIPASKEVEELRNADGALVGRVTRRCHALMGSVTVSVEGMDHGLCKVCVDVVNETPCHVASAPSRDEMLMDALVSTHTILRLSGGQFVSLLEPPEAQHEVAAGCRNVGVWPVLVGDPPERHTMLASPIILYDYPQVAPESAGDLCDGTEIDEILMLRIMTLTDEEKNAMRSLDPLAREILERTELMPEEQFLKMHGAIRGMQPVRETTR